MLSSVNASTCFYDCQIWDTRTRDGIQRTINGPHICGDGLDIKVTSVLISLTSTSKVKQKCVALK